MLRIFCEIISAVFTIISYYVSYPVGIFYAQMKGQCWVTML